MASDSAEVAEDYRLALEDLSSNMRFEISNLTVIARENTEHALAIAEVLQQHILKAPPNKKLPALYVLDSIVKNVGTPYTLYFGRNLFKTFMESYVVVDNNIRRKMEEMLRTWKDPVPGSMDTRPVFSHELVRPIENALMKARAASMPQPGQLPGRPRSAMMPLRDTPPPQGMRPTGAPAGYPAQHYPQHGAMPGQVPYPGQQHGAYYPPQTVPQPVSSIPALLQHTGPGSYGSTVPPASAGISVETLSNDIQNLIVAMRAEFSQNPHDASIQNRLKALLDLQGVLQRTSLPPDQLELIKNKVTELSAVTMRANPAQTPTPTLAPVPPQAHPVPAPSTSVTPSAAPGGPFAAPQVTLDSLLGPGALAALLSRQSAAPQSSTPNPPYAAAIRSPPPAHVEMAKPPPAPPAATAPPNPLGLLEQLRKAGLIPSTGSPAGGGTPVPPPPVFPPNLASILSQAKANSPRPGFDSASKSLFDPAALKQQFNPAIITGLYDDLGIPCTQCGRRFKTDEGGRRKKTAHMDWHFRVHQRSTEAEKRGTHRSWYVDHQDWLKSREVVDTDHVAAPEESGAQDSKGSGGFQPKYIPVPDSSSGINNVCPICQDRFENQWLDAAQEWVWLDAVLVGNRAYHASCHTEATRDREGTPGPSRRTPEPILGKRKAEVSISSPKVRSLKTFA